jgi:hypothetical protein
MKLILAMVTVLTFCQCAVKKSKLASESNASSAKIGRFTVTELAELIESAASSEENTKPIMALMTLESNYLHLVNEFQNALLLTSSNTERDAAGLAIADGFPKSGVPPTIDQQKQNLLVAESYARQAMDQQRLMLDQNRAGQDYSMRVNDFYKGLDAQKFDQSLRAAAADVDNTGKSIKNLQDLIEARKKNIEANILQGFQIAYNSYVKSFHDYSLAMSQVMKSAQKVSRTAGVLAGSVLEFDRRVRSCTSESNRRLYQDYLHTVKRLNAEDYTKINFKTTSTVRLRADAIEQMPFGKECLEYGLMQANLETYPADISTESYINDHPIFNITVKESKSSATPSGRTAVICPDASQAELQEQFLKPIKAAKDFMSAAAPDSAKENAPNEGNPVKIDRPGEAFDQIDKADLALTLRSPEKRADQKSLLVFFPASPFQIVSLLRKGVADFAQSNAGAMCASKSTSDDDAKSNYVSSIRDFEALKQKRLQSDLEAHGVKFESANAGKILSTRPYNISAVGTNYDDMLNSILRKGFFYAQECTSMVGDFMVGAGKGATPPQADPKVLPPTEFTIGDKKYSFFYPPFSVAVDSNTTRDDLSKITRSCVDAALYNFSKTQPEVAALKDISDLLNAQSSALKPPASPVPYIPNPNPGVDVYKRL